MTKLEFHTPVGKATLEVEWLEDSMGPVKPGSLHAVSLLMQACAATAKRNYNLEQGQLGAPHWWEMDMGFFYLLKAMDTLGGGKDLVSSELRRVLDKQVHWPDLCRDVADRYSAFLSPLLPLFAGLDDLDIGE